MQIVGYQRVPITLRSATGLEQPKKHGQPDEAFDQEKQKAGHAELPEPNFPILLFHREVGGVEGCGKV